ncbi:hypothetical protein DOTSEDRAFT_34189 [Dothistroma septosporum NZE10]|uniref:Uncharacterized protein n=1 Tax=Dothistroma septosporum (strain NZE10 / CBS 128990) TaxID=675120 RepID=N1PS20_DOTSN|nr:hypothetical protein DOTSEDRAFT_34189 [Dothistroma septosporum NZE10]
MAQSACLCKCRAIGMGTENNIHPSHDVWLGLDVDMQTSSKTRVGPANDPPYVWPFPLTNKSLSGSGVFNSDPDIISFVPTNSISFRDYYWRYPLPGSATISQPNQANFPKVTLRPTKPAPPSPAAINFPPLYLPSPLPLKRPLSRPASLSSSSQNYHEDLANARFNSSTGKITAALHLRSVSVDRSSTTNIYTIFPLPERHPRLPLPVAWKDAEFRLGI